MDTNTIPDILAYCNTITGLSTALNEGLRDSIVDLGTKIEQDNYGTRTDKDSDFHNLIDSVDVVSEIVDVNELVIQLLKKVK